MNGAMVVTLILLNLIKIGKTHGVMRIRNGKPLFYPEQTSRRRYKRLREDHRRDSKNAQGRLAIVEGLGCPATVACKVALMVIRSFPKTVQPIDKMQNGIPDAL